MTRVSDWNLIIRYDHYQSYYTLVTHITLHFMAILAKLIEIRELYS